MDEGLSQTWLGQLSAVCCLLSLTQLQRNRFSSTAAGKRTRWRLSTLSLIGHAAISGVAVAAAARLCVQEDRLHSNAS